MLKTKVLLSVGLMLVAAEVSACLQTPVPGTLITSTFGMRFHPVQHVWKLHRGTDMRAAVGTPLQASQSGTVIGSGYDPTGGNSVTIVGGDGTRVSYMHLFKNGVNIGSQVNAGQIIGLTGDSGDAKNSPHLHYQVANASGSLVDARTMLCEQLALKPGALNDGVTPPADAGPMPTADNLSAPPFDTYEGMSETDMMHAEASRRFEDASWHQKITACGVDGAQQQIDALNGKPGSATPVNCKLFLRQEIIEMKAFQAFMNQQKYEQRERIAAMLAVQNAVVEGSKGQAALEAQRKATALANKRN